MISAIRNSVLFLVWESSGSRDLAPGAEAPGVISRGLVCAEPGFPSPLLSLSGGRPGRRRGALTRRKLRNASARVKSPGQQVRQWTFPQVAGGQALPRGVEISPEPPKSTNVICVILRWWAVSWRPSGPCARRLPGSSAPSVRDGNPYFRSVTSSDRSVTRAGVGSYRSRYDHRPRDQERSHQECGHPDDQHHYGASGRSGYRGTHC